MSRSPDLYAVLHLTPEATPADIGRAYRSLLRRHHPDLRPAPATQDGAAAERELLGQIMDAHNVLADPVQRARYPRQAPGTATGQGPCEGALVSGPAPLSGQPPIVAGPLRWEPPR